MVAPLVLYLVAMGTTVLFIAAAYVYYESDNWSSRALSKWGLTPKGMAGAVIGGAVVVAFIALVGGLPALPADAYQAFTFLALIWSIPIVAGLVGVHASHTFFSRYRRLHPDNDVSTGAVAAGPVACTGEVSADTTKAAPVTGRETCCWSWSVEVRNPHGAVQSRQRNSWDTMADGSGGVRFRVDDGSGPIWVEPEHATLELRATEHAPIGPNSSPPSGFRNPALDIERQHRDKQRRYVESILSPGDSVAIAGTAREVEEGMLVDGPDTLIALGTLSTVANRYRTRALAAAFVSVPVCGFGCWKLGQLFGIV